ncbi:MAG: fumarate hydratase [Erysipelotrichaceae bacterium]
MREVSVRLINEKIYEAFSELCFRYETDIRNKIEKAFDSSTGREKKVLELLIENEREAYENRVPLCQDTGMAVIKLEIGQEVYLYDGDINETVNDAVRRAYKDSYLRLSVVDDPLFERINTGDNTPALISYEIVPGDKIKIYCMAKGFGSENASRLVMLNPAEGIEGIKREVLNCVKEKGANACPPLSIGIGIGGSFDKVAYLAKKALLREEEYNRDERYRNLEIELKDMINKLGIGPAGLKGDNTCLSVKVEYFPTHIAGLPFAINVNCHAVRKAVIEL